MPHGFRVENRQLLVREDEAEEVQYIFNRYAELKSVPKLVDDLAARDFRTRKRVISNGKIMGGVHIRTGAVTLMLHNPIYIGKIRHKDKVYDGAHEPIINEGLFDRVQVIFARNRRDSKLGKRSRNPSLLTGMITDPDGRSMSPTQANKGSKCYRCYSTRLKPLEDKASAWHLPAGELEGTVIGAIANNLETELIKAVDGDSRDQDLIARYRKTAKELPSLSMVDKRKLLLACHTKVQVKDDAVRIIMQPEELSEPLTITVDCKPMCRGSEVRVTLAPDNGPAKHEPDPVLLRLIAHAFAAQNLLVRKIYSPMVNHYKQRHLQQLVRLSFMAPDIISAIVNGIQPQDLTGRKINRINKIPLDWPSQRKMFGFPAA